MTEIKSEFRTKLEAIKKEYEAERKGLNIFRALHKEHDEKYLHSRFISYLLSPTSTHGMGNKFLEAFIDIISVKNPNFRKFKIDNCTIHPNENKKEEIEYIDILIENDNQAIVIENKIFAKASYHKGNIHQIDTYCKKMKKGKK